MGKVSKWTVEVFGDKHFIEYRVAGTKLFIDGEEKSIKSKNKFVTIIDETIYIESKKIQLVVVGGKADLAIDGFFLGSKKEYRPIERLPMWAWIFLVICILQLIMLPYGGRITVLFTAIGVGLCLINSFSPIRTNKEKVILNTIITILTWGIDIGIISLLTR